MISKEKKAAIIAQYGRKPGDTGSPEVQIAILTEENQRTDRASEEQPEGSPFQTWSAEDGRTETWSAGLLKRLIRKAIVH